MMALQEPEATTFSSDLFSLLVNMTRPPSFFDTSYLMKYTDGAIASGEITYL
jgi:hypothetical protein